LLHGYDPEVVDFINAVPALRRVKKYSPGTPSQLKQMGDR
jgi:hypothetical protein